MDSSDPYSSIRIFRREMVDSSAGRSFALSVDAPMKKLVDMFCDYEGKRCKLCNEHFLQWHSHQNCIPHTAREALVLELLRANCGTPEELVSMWWYRLNHAKTFDRMPDLSHDNSHIRKRRIQYLLRILKDRKILVDTFNVIQTAAAGAGRTWEFERLECLGDHVVKYVFNNRINCIFPVREGGIRSRLGYIQFLIDGNDGLARAYDYLELQKLTQSDRVVSKFKSDVVETLFGELQMYLWSTEEDRGVESFPLPFSKSICTVRALVSHVMEELAHVIFMFHIEYVLGALQRIVRENQLQFIKSEPTSRGGATAQEALQTLYGKRTAVTATSNKIMAHKAPHAMQGSNGAALYLESTNYDRFKRVVSLGGLLPRTFAPTELSPTPTYMPHLQHVRCVGDMDNAIALSDGYSWEASAGYTRDAYYAVSRSPQPRPPVQSARLSIPTLKDENLIAELV